MKDKIKRFIEVMLILHIIIVVSVSVYYSKFYDPLTYGQIISKEHIPKHLEEMMVFELIPMAKFVSKNIIMPEEYKVIIQGRSKKGKIKNKTIYLNSNQYKYTRVGDFVDIGKGR